MGNKHEELEAILQQENNYVVVITEMRIFATELLHWIAVDSSERIGWEAEAVKWTCMLQSVLTLLRIMMVMTELSDYGQESGGRPTK